MTKIDMLKSLAPGFLPLIVFIVADSLWGTRIGLIVAVAVGILELVISYVKEKIIDKFVLVDIGLIVLLGGVSIILDDPIFFKLKPALIEAMFCVILGVSIFSRMNIMLMMSKRYMKNIAFNDAQVQQLNRSLKALFYIFICHTILIVYSAFFMSKQAWAFISGGLFYILFAVYLVYEFVKIRLKRKRWLGQHQDEEWFDIVDEEGNVKGKAPRSVCHSGPGLLHTVIHIHIADDRDRIFLQKRSQKKEILPGKWDAAVGGHVLSGETIGQALYREAAEELGIENLALAPVARYVWQSDIESELVFMFFARYSKAITVADSEEIEEGRFWKIKKIKESLGKGIFTPNFEHEFDILLKQVFKT